MPVTLSAVSLASNGKSRFAVCRGNTEQQPPVVAHRCCCDRRGAYITGSTCAQPSSGVRNSATSLQHTHANQTCSDQNMAHHHLIIPARLASESPRCLADCTVSPLWVLQRYLTVTVLLANSNMIACCPSDHCPDDFCCVLSACRVIESPLKKIQTSPVFAF